jgi:hypothetical protein
MKMVKKGRGEEQITANQEEQDFKSIARRNKLLGLWLAEILGITDAESYAKEVVIADLDEPGDDDIIRKVMKDIADNDGKLTEEDIRSKLQSLLVQVKAEG